MNDRFSLRTLLVVGTLLGPCAAASAGPRFSASITGQPSVRNSPLPVSLMSSVDDSFGRHGEGEVFAGAVLRAEVETVAGPRGFFNGLSTEMTAGSAATFDDIVIGGPGAFVEVTLHVPFDATFFQTWSTMQFADFIADASRTIQSADFTASFQGTVTRLVVRQLDELGDIETVGTLTNRPGAGTVVPGDSPGPSSVETDGVITRFTNIPQDADGFLYLLSRTRSPVTGSTLGHAGAGFLNEDVLGLRGEMVITSTVPVNQPLTLSLQLAIGSRTFGGFALNGFGDVDALHTFGIPQGGRPVFDLPDGYTANSESLGIVNNVVPNAGAVPAPSSLALCSVALVALAARRKHLLRRRG